MAPKSCESVIHVCKFSTLSFKLISSAQTPRLGQAHRELSVVPGVDVGNPPEVEIGPVGLGAGDGTKAGVEAGNVVGWTVIPGALCGAEMRGTMLVVKRATVNVMDAVATGR